MIYWSTDARWRHGEFSFFVSSNMADGFENVNEIIPEWTSEDIE